MIRILTASAAALLLTAASAHAEGAHTTRVVPTHVYGATVTIEEGVRVFRPLPSDRHVIVNPGGKTDVEIEVHEYNPTSQRTIRR